MKRVIRLSEPSSKRLMKTAPLSCVIIMIFIDNTTEVYKSQPEIRRTMSVRGIRMANPLHERKANFGMKKSDFFYSLPEELIAQTPALKRDESRLMSLDKNTGEINHIHFYDIVSRLNKGDCLVLNDSRVLPARLIGERETGGAVEVLLLRDVGNNTWEALTKPGRKTKAGTMLSFGDGKLTAVVEREIEDGKRLIRFSFNGIFLEVLDELGRMPLPPYIHKYIDNPERYQTVYSRVPGSAAAPTAGLHFTAELMNSIRDKGVEIAFITLHVGLSTFRPVKVTDIKDHVMHSEYFEIPDKSAEIISRTVKSGNRVIAVGTTSCRTLESAAGEDGSIKTRSGWTDIFIYPGYKFKLTDALITNFHLPESTLIMLVSAFADREKILNAYQAAIDEEYRFFSFGDAMFIY